jgi:hypothetical protein
MLKCEICNTPFDLFDHSPTQLPCQHTFCHACCSKKSKCPLDEKPFTISNCKKDMKVILENARDGD